MICLRNMVARSSGRVFYFYKSCYRSPPLQNSVQIKTDLSDWKESMYLMTFSFLQDLRTLISVLTSYYSLGVSLINFFDMTLMATWLLSRSSTAR